MKRSLFLMGLVFALGLSATARAALPNDGRQRRALALDPSTGKLLFAG